MAKPWSHMYAERAVATHTDIGNVMSCIQLQVKKLQKEIQLLKQELSIQDTLVSIHA